VPWEASEPQDDMFDTEAVEEIIARPGSRGRHLFLRLYCQWDGAEPDVESTACPSWLSTERGVPYLRSSTGTMMWDFNDDAFLEEAREVIAAFGERYDDDPCIFAVQLGILGMWGEWHTFTFRDGYSFSATVQAGILEAYREAFVNRRVVARYPWHEPLSSAPWLGDHNDYFLANNGHSDEFDDAVAARSLWRQDPHQPARRLGNQGSPLGPRRPKRLHRVRQRHHCSPGILDGPKRPGGRMVRPRIRVRAAMNRDGPA
jgi:hypothetical protein